MNTGSSPGHQFDPGKVTVEIAVILMLKVWSCAGTL